MPYGTDPHVLSWAFGGGKWKFPKQAELFPAEEYLHSVQTMTPSSFGLTAKLLWVGLPMAVKSRLWRTVSATAAQLGGSRGAGKSHSYQNNKFKRGKSNGFYLQIHVMGITTETLPKLHLKNNDLLVMALNGTDRQSLAMVKQLSRSCREK